MAINETWYFHAGANEGNNTLANIRNVIDRRYGPSVSAEEFARKAQLAHYENTRAQFEGFAANGWPSQDDLVLDAQQQCPPSSAISSTTTCTRRRVLRAKKGLRPLSVVFDSYATGDHSQAKITVVNQTPKEQMACAYAPASTNSMASFVTTAASMASVTSACCTRPHLTPAEGSDPVYFVRCELFDGTGKSGRERLLAVHKG